MSQSFGERAVGLKFNPTDDSNVARLKRSYANLIDELHGLRQELGDTQPDAARMLSIAITEAQTSQMWAVKAVTWEK